MRILLASACLLILSTSAYSADAIVSDGPAVIRADTAMDVAEPVSERWGGVYAGASVGYGFLNDSGAPTGPASGRDWIFGGYAGYNHQMGNLVLGVEGNVDRADIMFTDGSQVASEFIYAARFRAGYATDKFMIYGTIGAEHGTTKKGVLPIANDPKDTTVQFGGGFDVAVTDKVSMGVDYTYAKYKNFDHGNIPFPLDVTTQKVAARLTYTFN